MHANGGNSSIKQQVKRAGNSKCQNNGITVPNKDNRDEEQVNGVVKKKVRTLKCSINSIKNFRVGGWLGVEKNDKGNKVVR